MKRSAQVALVVMTAAGVGGTAYALMPSERCQRVDGGAPVDPAVPACRSASGSGSSYRGSRWSFGSSDSARSNATPTKAAAPGAGTSRGGFGSFFSSLGSHIAGS